MKYRTLKKDSIRLIRTSRMRFFSLTAIVMLGVAFYVGVSSSSTMMAENIDVYNDGLSLKDITVYSNYGFDEEDIAAIGALEDVERAEGAKFVDVVANMGDSAEIARIHSYDPQAEINRFVLRDGRMPENIHEVLAEKGTDLMPGPAIGTVVTLSRPDNDLEDWLAVDRFTIVGTVDTPVYLNETKENSTLSNRYIDTYFYIPEDAFTVEYDLEVNVLFAGAKAYNSFYDPYEVRSDEVKDEIERLGKTQSLHRYDEIMAEAMEKYNDGLKEYEEGKEDFDREIRDAEKKLRDARAEIDDGYRQIADARDELNDAQRTLDEQIGEGRKEIAEGKKELAEGKKQLEEGRKEFEEQKKTYTELKKQLQDAVAQLEEARDGLKQIDDGIDQLSALKEQLEEIREGNIPVRMFLEAYPEVQELVSALGLPEDTTVRDLITMDLSDTEAVQEAADRINEVLGPVLDENVRIGELTEQIPYLSELLSLLGLDENSSASEVLKKLTDTAISELPAIQELIGQISPDYDRMLADLPLAYLKGYDAQLDQLIAEYGLTDDNTLQDLIDRVDEQISGLRKMREEAVEQLKDKGIEASELDELIRTYRQNIQDIDTGLADGAAQLAEAEKAIRDGEAALAAGEAELERQRQDAQKQINDGWAEINENWQKLLDAEKEYSDGVRELADARADGEQELADAKADLDKAWDDISSLEEGTWTVLNREQHYASRTFRNTVQQMAAIAEIFPLFFILVAALVCLTTMTRMVDEQRGQIGIMMALGYTRFQSALKYLVYALLAGIIGSVIGSFVGLLIFPAVIYNAWRMM